MFDHKVQIFRLEIKTLRVLKQTVLAETEHLQTNHSGFRYEQQCMGFFPPPRIRLRKLLLPRLLSLTNSSQ